MEEPVPHSPKKIRLTKSEVYAMGLSSPRKRKIAFGLVGLLIAVALGNVLWHFQEFWLPYWFPAAEPPAPAVPADRAGAPETAAAEKPAPASAPARLDAQLDFLTAAMWENPRFQQGVRLFNRALDLYRLSLRKHATAAPPQIEEDALQAARMFEALRPEAPANIPLSGYVARCQQLVLAARQLGRPGGPQTSLAPAAAAPVPPPPRPEVVPYHPGEPWQHPDYLQGARLFNQALEQYQQFLTDKSRTELLAPIEETAFQAAKKFEALKGIAPEGVPLGDHITQCYKLISDCRRQNLEGAGGQDNGKPFDRGTTGPARRPALPAYQPPPAP